MSPSVPNAVKIAGAGLLAAGTVAAGTAIGIAVQRRLVARAIHDDADWVMPVFTPDVHQVLMRDGTSLHVEVDACPGTETPVTVVLCHGYALSSASMVFQRAALQGRARVISYDQRSHGRSGRGVETTHTVDELGVDLMTIIDRLAPEGPLLLVGHSMGGMTVMALADQHPELFAERVRGVMLMSTTAGDFTTVSFGMPAIMRTVVHRAMPAMASVLARGKGLVETGRRASSDLTEIVFRAYSFGASPSREASEFVAGMIDSTPMDVLAEFLPALQEHDKFSALPTLAQCDVVVVVGDQDRLTPVVHSERLAACIRGSQLAIVVGGGHMVGIEYHHEVDQLLLELLDRVQAGLPEHITRAAS